MSSRFAFAAGALLASLAALPLSAQQTSGGKQHDTTAATAPSAKSASTDSALVDLGRAITELAVSVQKIVDQSRQVRHLPLHRRFRAADHLRRGLQLQEFERGSKRR